jgi:hypothetical protein
LPECPLKPLERDWFPLATPPFLEVPVYVQDCAIVCRTAFIQSELTGDEVSECSDEGREDSPTGAVLDCYHRNYGGLNEE